jgi:hypothetical protein
MAMGDICGCDMSTAASSLRLSQLAKAPTDYPTLLHSSLPVTRCTCCQEDYESCHIRGDHLSINARLAFTQGTFSHAKHHDLYAMIMA